MCAVNKAKHRPTVKLAIHAVTQAGTTTSPRAAMPRPAISEAVMTWLAGSSDGKMAERQAEPHQGADDDFADQQPLRHLACPSGRHG